jgi:hypothetical protein
MDVLDFSSFSFSGQGLNVEERAGLEVAINKRRLDDGLREVQCWGKQFGEGDDYLVVVGFGASTDFPNKRFFYACVMVPCVARARRECDAGRRLTGRRCHTVAPLPRAMQHDQVVRAGAVPGADRGVASLAPAARGVGSCVAPLLTVPPRGFGVQAFAKTASTLSGRLKGDPALRLGPDADGEFGSDDMPALRSTVVLSPSRRCCVSWCATRPITLFRILS